MKIAICGVSSTGKSTLSRILARQLTLPLVHEGMKDIRRAYKEKGQEIKNFRDQNEVERLTYQVELIQYRLEKEFQYESFVADGSALDMIAFYRMFSWIIPYNLKIETLKGLTVASSCYDYVFYLPFGVIPVEDDGRRMIDMVNLETVDMVLKGVIAQAATTVLKDKIWILNERTVDQRVRAVLKIVKPEAVAAFDERAVAELEELTGVRAGVPEDRDPDVTLVAAKPTGDETIQ